MTQVARTLVQRCDPGLRRIKIHGAIWINKSGDGDGELRPHLRLAGEIRIGKPADALTRIIDDRPGLDGTFGVTRVKSNLRHRSRCDNRKQSRSERH